MYGNVRISTELTHTTMELKDLVFESEAQARRDTGLSYLGNINSSAKMIDNMKVSDNYTYIIYLASANLSGYNVCPKSTAECRGGCLLTSGHAGMDINSGKDIIMRARILKTKLYFENRNFFVSWMIAEMTRFQKKAKKDGYHFSARLNGTSDIDWATNSNIMNFFSNVQFYDYTKVPERFLNKPKNYHLTFSYTGYNWKECEKLLDWGYNVAVVFDKKKSDKFPLTFKGYPVINGDLTDYRPNDPKGAIVGLKWKRIANKEVEAKVRNSPFVVKL